MKTLRALIIIQAAYTLVTAIWPLIHIESFMLVTGYKTDVWLVKTVAALLLPISLCLGSFLFVTGNKLPAFVLGLSTAFGLACIDFYYALNNRISEIYLADGALEGFFVIAWIYIAYAARLFKGQSRYEP